MRVACFCGTYFHMGTGQGACPKCGEPVFLPMVAARDSLWVMLGCLWVFYLFLWSLPS